MHTYTGAMAMASPSIAQDLDTLHAQQGDNVLDFSRLPIPTALLYGAYREEPMHAYTCGTHCSHKAWQFLGVMVVIMLKRRSQGLKLRTCRHLHAFKG